MQQNKGMKDDGLDPGSTVSPKLRYDLLPMREVEEIVKVLTFGSKKYADNSWQQVEKRKERYYAAMMRHISLWRQGEIIDPDSGLPHLSHVACNVIFLLFDYHDQEKISAANLPENYVINPASMPAFLVNMEELRKKYGMKEVPS